VRTILKLSALLFILPLSVLAGVAEQYELEVAPDVGVASNVVVDAIAHGLTSDSIGIWLATGKGVNFSFDDGQTWLVYDATNGLVSDNISAMYSIDGRLWLGTNHNELIDGELFSLSDALSYSDDNGATWTQVNFGSSGLDIPFVWGGDRTIFDITGHVDTGFFNQQSGEPVTEWMFFSAFAGGLLASQDGGMNWRRIFASAADSIQYFSGGAPSLRNRVFSCAADSSHGDSLFLWSGTAGGLFQYVYITPREKFFSRAVNRMAFCDTCSDSANGAFLFIAGNNGLSRGTAIGGPYDTRFEVDGLPGPYISSLIDVGGHLLVGTVDPVSGASTGLAVSTDLGDSFSPISLAQVTGIDNVISDFEIIRSPPLVTRIYMAAQAAGLFLSLDTGLTWISLPVDTFTAADVNTVNALDRLGNTLWVGTDAGLVTLFMDPVGGIDSSSLTPFIESDSSSSSIVRIRRQLFMEAPPVVDSMAIWTVHRPTTASGAPMVGRYSDATDEWQHLQVQALVYDVDFFGDTAFVVGEFGARFTETGGNPENEFPIQQLDEFGFAIDDLDEDTVTVMEVRGDTVLFGSTNGFVYSSDRGETFNIVRANRDTLGADFVINHTYTSSLNFEDQTYGITGDFIPALVVNYQDSGTADVWVSGRAVTQGFAGGRSVGRFDQPVLDSASQDTLYYRLRWQAVDTLNFAWNFEFAGDSTFAATSSGLFLDTGSALFASIEIPLVDDATGRPLVDAGTGIFAVKVVDSFLWVGTDDGTVRLSLASLDGGQLFIKIDSTSSADEVYAFPVPFRPIQGQTLDFHFVVEQPGDVTLEVYDFAMNLVARPIDNVHYDAGVYPDGQLPGITWDGHNGKGDVVAVGVYYFKVEFESGQVRWGKLAVIP